MTFNFKAGDKVCVENGLHKYITITAVGKYHFLGVSAEATNEYNEHQFPITNGWKLYVEPQEWKIATEMRIPRFGEYYISSDGRLLYAQELRVPYTQPRPVLVGKPQLIRSL
jgi:hypothetical protein